MNEYEIDNRRNAVLALLNNERSHFQERFNDRRDFQVIQLQSQSDAAKWVGHSLDTLTSQEVTLALAVKAHQQATRQCPGDLQRSTGIACHVVENQSHKVGHTKVIQIAAHKEHQTLFVIVRLSNPKVSVPGQPLPPICTEIIQALADTENEFNGATWQSDERVEIVSQCVMPANCDHSTETNPVAWSLPNGDWQSAINKAPAGLLCGSFNPLHHGHVKLRDVSESLIGGPVYYELCLQNADKPPLDFISLENRRQQFREHPLAVSRAATFVQKSAIFPRTTFVIGADTAVRLLDPKFYDNSTQNRDAAFAVIERNAGRFLVAARQTDSQILTLDDMTVPSAYGNLFSPIPTQAFLMDVSSTGLRQESR